MADGGAAKHYDTVGREHVSQTEQRRERAERARALMAEAYNRAANILGSEFKADGDPERRAAEERVVRFLREEAKRYEA